MGESTLERRSSRHAGLAPLPLAAVAAKAHAQNGVIAAMAHGFNRWSWSHATFGIAGEPWTADIDALAVRRAGGEFVCLDRTYAKFPPTDFNRIGTSYTSLAARRSASRSSGRPARSGSPRPIASSNAVRPWRPRSCSDRRKAASPWASAMRCSRPCRFTRMGPETGNGTWGSTSWREAPTCRSMTSRSRHCRPSTPASGRKEWRKS